VRSTTSVSAERVSVVLLAVASLFAAACPKKAATPTPSIPAREIRESRADGVGGTVQDAVPPAPEPEENRPSPQMLTHGSEPLPAREELEGLLSDADELLSVLGDRELSPEQTGQKEAAEAFLLQARAAMNDGDLKRCSFLVEKSLVLAREVEQNARPRPDQAPDDR